MSVKLMSQVWGLDVSRDRKIVLLALADHADDDGYCFPSAAYVAWKTEYSERQIQRILDQLEKEGIILVAREHTPTTPRIYKLALDNATKKPEYQRKPSGRGDVWRGDISASRGDISTARGDIAVSPEPSLEPSLEPSRVSGAKSAPPPDEREIQKPPDAPVVVAAKERIRRILEDQAVLRPEVASPREAERAFVRRFSPLMAAIFGRDRPIREDKAATRDMFAFRCDEDWLAERLTMLAGEAGNVYRQPSKNGKEPCAYWVRDAIEKEWSVYRKEKADADERKRADEDYERRLAAELSRPAGESDGDEGWQEAGVSGVYLHGGGPPAGADGVCVDVESGVAVDTARELQMPGDGMGMRGLSERSDHGQADGSIPEMQGRVRRVRDMFRDEKRKRYLAAVDGAISQREQADNSP